MVVTDAPVKCLDERCKQALQTRSVFGPWGGGARGGGGGGGGGGGLFKVYKSIAGGC